MCYRKKRETERDESCRTRRTPGENKCALSLRRKLGSNAANLTAMGAVRKLSIIFLGGYIMEYVLQSDLFTQKLYLL